MKKKQMVWFTLGKKLHLQRRQKKMKAELKRKIFDSAASLCNFVNKCNITKENIQSIIENSGIFFLFYWEITV